MTDPEKWEKSVFKCISGDPLWRVQAYRLSLAAADTAWQDVTRLSSDRRTVSLANQLYRAIGSIGANIAEGYGRGSGRDRAHYYEYALGSAREARDWYYKARHVLGESALAERLEATTEIIRLLLVMIPAERGRALHESGPEYATGHGPETL